MGTKTGFLAGFAAGYVLGSRAGRERYEEIRAWWDRVTGNPTVRSAAERGRELAGTAGRKSLEAVQQGAQKVGSAVRDRMGEGDSGTEPQVG